MNPQELAALVADALAAAAASRGVALVVAAEDVPIERPKNPEHGDWSSNAAMRHAKPLGIAPRDLAAEIVATLAAAHGIAKAEIAGPGFINITLEAAAAGEVARTIVEQGAAYGRGEALAGVRVNLEFVSANPTGPIHIGGTRWAAVGDSLARILAAQGADVTREYYFNDHGAQIDRFARSLVASFLGQPAPDDGYGGQYIHEIKDRVVAAYPGDLGLLAPDELQETFRAIGVELMFGEIKASLHDFGVDFDVYFHENDLHLSGAVERAVAKLRERGVIDERDGAIWLRTTEFGDDKDRVVIKSNGEAAYLSGDIAYYEDKRERGFDRCIIMLGADHHGYVGRMMAMCAAFGDTPGVHLEIMIGQLVNLVRTNAETGEKEPVRMSKRAGTVVTLEDLVDAIGVDAARYALARTSTDSNIDLDLDVLASRTNDNPVFYVQYAHARTRSVARNAVTAGVDRSAFDAALLSHETEARLLGSLAEFPRVVRQAAEWREPHRIARYLEELAGTFHRWYDVCRVTPLRGQPVTDLHRTRLWLNDAVTTVLASGLGLLGVTAPDRM